MKRRGKIVALSTAAMGVAVLGLAGFAAKDRIREEWYLHEAESDDYERSYQAIEVLGEMRSAHAVPAIIEAWRQLFRNPQYGSVGGSGFWVREYVILRNALSKIGKAALPSLVTILSDPDDECAYRFANKFVNICALTCSSPAVTAALDGLYDKEAGIHSLHGKIDNVVPLLQALSDDAEECIELRAAAAHALKKLLRQ